MQPHTPEDVAGTGSRVTLASILGVDQCKWFQVTAELVADAPIRVGDSGISTSRGVPIGVGGAQFSPPIAMTMDFYDLTKWYILVQIGDTASVVCAI